MTDTLKPISNVDPSGDTFGEFLSAPMEPKGGPRQYLYIATMQDGPDLFRDLVTAPDMDEAKAIAELRHGCRCVNIRRAASHPGR